MESKAGGDNMSRREQIAKILKKINAENISNAIDALSRGTEQFNRAVQDFGDSMGTLDKEMSSDVERSNRESKIREKKNRENLERIWGKRK